MDFQGVTTFKNPEYVLFVDQDFMKIIIREGRFIYC